jgi:signal transduction histidine kinase
LAVAVSISESRIKYASQLIVSALLFFTAAKVGYSFALYKDLVSLIWPPAGIALALVLVYGYRILPGIAIGSIILSISNGSNFIFAAGSLVSQMAEPALGAFLLTKFGFDKRISKISDIVKLLTLGAVVAPLVIASIETFTICMSAHIPFYNCFNIYFGSFMGNAMGIVVMAPFMLAWSGTKFNDYKVSQYFEFFGMALGLLAVTFIIYGNSFITEDSRSLAYLVFPFIIWASLRFEVKGASTAIFLISVIAAVGTVKGFGPFSNSSVYYGLFYLYVFIAATSITALILGTTSKIKNSAQNSLKETQNLLEMRVKERTEKLEGMNFQKDRLFSIISHDLRSPFQSLLGFSDFIVDDFDTLSREEIKRYLGHIRDSARNVYSLIENLLHWTRLQTGKLEFNPVELDLGAEIEAIVKKMNSLAEKKDIRIFNRINSQIFFFADPYMLNILLVNLLDNAIKFSHKDSDIDIELERNADFLMLKITDSGIGMNAEELNNLFKVEIAHKKRGTADEKGTGLGLLICNEVMKKHRGKISVGSEPDKGTVLTVYFPI